MGRVVGNDDGSPNHSLILGVFSTILLCIFEIRTNLPCSELVLLQKITTREYLTLYRKSFPAALRRMGVESLIIENSARELKSLGIQLDLAMKVTASRSTMS